MHGPYKKIDPNQEATYLRAANHAQKDKDNKDYRGKLH